MSFINSSNHLYGQASADDGLSFILNLSGDVKPAIFVRNADDLIALDLLLNSDIASVVGFTNSIDLGIALGGDLTAQVTLNLIQPAPILSTLPLNPFRQTVRGRLKANNIEIPFKSVTYNAPKDNLGSSLAIELSKADLSFLPGGAAYKFEIGAWNGASFDWETILESGKLDSRNLSRGWSSSRASDNLSFSTLSDVQDKFNLGPRKNTICFDENKTRIDLTETETLYDTDGAAILTEKRNFNGLSLYQVLQIAFVEGCGFTSFETNIPNYPLSRVDFNITQSYKDTASPFIGIFKPIFIPRAGGVLRILDGTQAISIEFAPREVTADSYSGIGLQKQPVPRIDGYIVSFQSTVDYSTWRLRADVKTLETGNLFDPNYTMETVTSEYRDYYDDANPEVVTKEELQKVTTTTEDTFGNILGEEVEEFTFVAAGQLLEKTKTTRANVPLPVNNFEGSLETVRTERQSYDYQSDRTGPRRVILAKITTEIQAVVAVDKRNKYFEADFRQEYLEGHRAGNLNKDMTYSPFPEPVKNIVETYEQTGANGQIRVTTKTIDLLRKIPVISVSDAKNGDISIPAGFSKTRNVLVWRVGANRTAKGKPLAGISVGELPLVFAKPLVQRILAKQDAQPNAGTISVLGYSRPLERGVFITLLDRDETNFGKFLVEGYSWTIQANDRGQKVETQMQVSEV